MYDTTIADRLRAEGLDVVECDGWQTRGRSELYPGGFVFHHTADGPNGATPSLNGVIYGFAGSAPGPLANLLQSREPDGHDKVYVVAAGTANHAGSGGWHGLSGNSSVWGLEIEHTGVEHFPEERALIAAKIAAAVIRGTADESMCCQHFEWSTAGKIDVAQDVDADHWRDLVRDALAGKAPEPEPVEDDDMLVVLCTDPPHGPAVWIFTEYSYYRCEASQLSPGRSLALSSRDIGPYFDDTNAKRDAIGLRPMGT